MTSRHPTLEASLSWTEDAVAALYRLTSVDPERFLSGLRERGLRAHEVGDLQDLDPAVREGVARDLIRSSRRISAASGVGLGMGGWIALAPELMHQLVMIMQLAQRLGMLHGVDYRTPAGEIELWKAVAAGMETPLDVQGTPRQVAARLPVAIGRTRLALGPVAGKVAFAVVKRLVLKLSTPMGRLVPVVGGSISLVSNYLLMGRVGRRMMAYYARRHGPLDGAGRVVAVVEVVRGAPSFNGGDAELGWES